MTELCSCLPEAGKAVCEMPAQSFQRRPPAADTCHECGRLGKPVGLQTVKAMLSVSLREIQDTNYLFCRTQSCPIVYFSADGKQTFSVEQVRERVYQKEPDAEDIFICYCFRHSVGDLRMASALVNDINTGIQAGQCACELRNPQGFCCLGNVRNKIKRLEKSALATT